MMYHAVRTLTILPFLAFYFAVQAAPAYFQEEYGKATFYANSLHGRRTASGEPYDRNELTCAHKTFPFGTRLRITRMDNNKSVIVRVNDRGPFIEGYVVDLSRRAAENIGMIDQGVVRVKVERADEPKKETAEEEEEAPKPVAHSTPAGKKITKPAPATESIKPVANSTPAGKKITKPAPAAEKATKPVAHSTGAVAKPSAKPVANNAPKGAKPATMLVKPLRPAQYSAITTEKSTTILYKTALTALPMTGFGVQVATLTGSASALREAAKLESLFPNKVLMLVEEGPSPEASVYKLVVGPAPSRAAADNLQRNVAKKPGYAKSFVVALDNL